MANFTTEELKEIAWRQGNLSYLLHRGQREAKAAFHDAKESLVYVICCSRRYGKSYLACVMSIEEALKKPGAQVRYAAQTKDAVKKIVRPLMSQILEECPKDLKPVHTRNEGVYRFPNGSEIHVAGAEAGAAERLRGTSTDFAVIDEAGFIDETNGGEDLENLVNDVLMPQTLTTGGRILLISTPAKSASHAFQLKYCLRAEAEGAYLHRTIYDAPHIDEKTREKYMKEAGGEDSPTWQREYLARVIVDATVAVIPEFSIKERDIVRVPPERPEFFDAYVGADLGYHDLTAVLFGYYHFPEAKIIVEDELIFHKTNSGAIVDAIREKEAELWGSQEPRKRVADVKQQIIRDLSVDYGMKFRQPKKDDKDAAINQLRLAIADEKLIIAPNCVNTIAHLKAAIWNKSRTEFARSGQFGHFDAVDALIYLIREVNRNANPFPQGRGLSHDTHYIPPKQELGKPSEIRKLVKISRRRGRHR